jgi:hypothetical protein
MRLIDILRQRQEKEESIIQMQILREDIARLSRMRELARSAADAGAYMRAALLLGWTAGNLRTQEIREPLETLAQAVYDFEKGARGDDQEACIEQAWVTLHRVRMERLMGCLSTPAPKPAPTT